VAQHLTRVLRLEVGAPLRVFDGRGHEFDATLEAVRRDAASVRLGTPVQPLAESPLQVTLLQGIARGEKMDLILQKATELGVTRVVPLTMARSNVRLDAASAARKQQHWQAVAGSAAEQCGRAWVPEIAAATPLPDAVQATGAQLKLLLAPDADAATLRTLLDAQGESDQKRMSICLLVGPEGGFDAEEIHIAREAGFRACRLGPRVLRTETAAFAALAALQFALGDLS
jgi:16S rRNA (uracil1498-N3)-methyltransferase